MILRHIRSEVFESQSDHLAVNKFAFDPYLFDTQVLCNQTGSRPSLLFCVHVKLLLKLVRYSSDSSSLVLRFMTVDHQVRCFAVAKAVIMNVVLVVLPLALSQGVVCARVLRSLF